VTINLHVNKRLLLIIVGFIAFVVLVSIVFIVVSTTNNNQPSPITNNPGGTGGDYVPANTLKITNDGVLYQFVGSSATTEIEALLQLAVVYNIPTSDNPQASSNFTQLGSFSDAIPSQFKKYKNNASYTATIDGNNINQDKNLPWNYWFTITTNDGRHFRVDAIADENGVARFNVSK
jgi:hypothetical protein